MNVSSDVATIPGWYGKLPSLGDFASRRLEADFIEPWDLWLGEALQAQRSALGEGWLDAYLDTPPWRFLLSPGALRGVRPDLAFAGVLVPSVDRVGRHFPLTLVASLSRVPDFAAEFDSLFAWLHRLEDTALDALQSDWTIDDLENALVELAPPGDEANDSFEDRLATMRRAVAAAVTHRGGFVDVAGVSSRADLAAIFASAPVAATTPRPPLRGLALWIADTPGRPQLLVSDGLPSIDDFVRMFAGGYGARSASATPGGVGVEDPLATLPQSLDAPAFALPAPAAAGHRDPLSLFQGSAAAPRSDGPARELLPDDDILAMFQVGGGPGATDAALPAEFIPEHDILGLYSPPVEAPSDAAPAAPKEGDILAMFSADESVPGELGSAGAPVKDDLLGLFDAPPDAVPFADSPAAPRGPEAPDTGPDILDMFGVTPVKPEGGETK